MKPGWRNLVALLAALLMSATGALAVENRFLLVIEATADSAKNTQATRDAVADLLVRGFNGIARPGDTVGVWIAGDRLDVSFPMLVWQPAAARAYAVDADKFLTKRPWVGRWNSTNVAPALKAVAADSDALTVILVTAPSSRLSDMPFSDNVTEIQNNAAADLERTRLPFVTFLTVREKRFTSAAVNSGMGPWTIPNPPLPKPPAPPVIVQAPAAKSGPPPKSIVGNSTKIEFSSTPPSKLPEVKASPALAAAKPAEPKPAIAVTASAPAPTVAATEPAKVAESKPITIPIPASAEPAKPAALVEAKPATQSAASPLPEPSPNKLEASSPKVEVTAPAKEVLPPRIVATVPATSGGGSGFLIAGIASLVGIGVLGWLALRRPKPAQRSLITQSFRVK